MALNFENEQNFVSGLFTANVGSQIVKVDVAPPTRAGANQFDACAPTNKTSDIPGLARHGLTAFTSLSVDNLKDANVFNTL